MSQPSRTNENTSRAPTAGPGEDLTYVFRAGPRASSGNYSPPPHKEAADVYVLNGFINIFDV